MTTSECHEIRVSDPRKCPQLSQEDLGFYLSGHSHALDCYSLSLKQAPEGLSKTALSNDFFSDYLFTRTRASHLDFSANLETVLGLCTLSMR